uniref:Uncharacterized protein n=1 Tax=Kalanchoe fedtschenkoi TaxID=63787 RepID=A0A7N0T9U9_KALFE
MGACSSRPSVLGDESRRVPAPEPQVEEITSEKDQAMAAEAEFFEDTLEHDPEEIPSKESKAAEGSEPEAPVVVEKEAIEAEVPKIVEAPLAAEDSNNVESNAVKAPASDNGVGTETEEIPAEPVEANASEEAPAPKDDAKPDNSEAAGGNPFQSFMSNITKGWGWR